MTTKEFGERFAHESKYHPCPKWVIMERTKGEKHWAPYRFVPREWDNNFDCSIFPTFKTEREASKYLCEFIYARHRAIKDGTEQPTWREKGSPEKEYFIDEILHLMRRVADDPDFFYILP